MEPQSITVTVEICITLPAPFPPDLGDILRSDMAEDYLYDQICSWVWCYAPQTLKGFDLAVSVIGVTQR